MFKKIFIITLLSISFNLVNAKEKVTRVPIDKQYILDDLSTDYYLGSDKALINVIVYSSYSCPHCVNFHLNVVNKLKKDIDANVIRYVNRIFIQKETLLAVILPFCAKPEHQYNLLNDLYNNVKIWKDSPEQINILREISLNNGFTLEEFEACIKNQSLANRILRKRDYDIKKLNITSTPTIYVNNRVVKGEINYDELLKIINEELENK